MIRPMCEDSRVKRDKGRDGVVRGITMGSRAISQSCGVDRVY